jgi:aspartate racemase
VVNDIIFDELCKGAVTEDSRAIYIKVAADLAFDGADSLILGCTEVGLLLNQGNTPLPVFDTTTIHCQAIIDAAFSEPL